MPRLPEVRPFVSSGGVKIYRIPCKVHEKLTARVYLVLEAGPPTLVDTGSGQGESTQNILDGFDTVRREFGEPIRIEDVRRIIITHGHFDHYGGLPELLQHTEAEICIHPLDSRPLSAGAQWERLARRAFRRLLAEAGVPPTVAEALLAQEWRLPETLPKLPVNTERLEQDKIDGLGVVHTPGHSAGHVCLVADDLLLCGDHVLAHTIPQLWPESLRPYKGLGHYLESLHVVRALPNIRLALPGHEPIIEDLSVRIDEITRSQHRRLEYIIDLLTRSGRPWTVWEIAQNIYEQITGFYALLALMATSARVEYLHQRGQLLLTNLDRIENDPAVGWEYRTD